MISCQAAVCVCRTAISMRKNRFVDNGTSEASMSIFPFSQPFRLYDKHSFSFYRLNFGRDVKRLTANVGDHSSNEIDQILPLSLNTIYLMTVHKLCLHYGAFIER